MKLTKLTKALLFSMLCIMMCACSDDDEPKIDNAEKELIATSWKGNMIGEKSDGSTIKTQVIVQFLTSDEGQFIELDDKGLPIYGGGGNNLYYHFERNIISFSGAMTGQWTITTLTKKRLVMESFNPYKVVLELERIM